MTERWEQIDQVFQAALALPALERDRFQSGAAGTTPCVSKSNRCWWRRRKPAAFLTPQRYRLRRALFHKCRAWSLPVNWLALTESSPNWAPAVWEKFDRARDPRLNRDVAIKFSRRNSASDSSAKPSNRSAESSQHLPPVRRRSELSGDGADRGRISRGSPPARRSLAYRKADC